MRALLFLAILSSAAAGCDGCGRALPIEGCVGRCPPDLGARDAAPDLGGPRDLGGDAGDLASPCAGLDEAACRADQRCVADDCLECSCTPTFVGCRLPSAPKTSCPALGCAQPACCRSTADCSANPGYMICVAPGEFPGCGACQSSPPCESDSDCPPDGGAGYWPTGPICDDPLQYGICESCYGGKTCIPGCQADSDCHPGQVCAAGHCVPQPCAQDADCLPEFQCASDQCWRRSCATDADCPAGFCVSGACYQALGTCMPAPI